RVLVLVVSGEKKQVGSTAGMQTSVDTSPLLKVRGDGPNPAPGGCVGPLPSPHFRGVCGTPSLSPGVHRTLSPFPGGCVGPYPHPQGCAGPHP
uniref:Mevalonate diphosphate decarboxylase n=1 Tax=Bubo bubo TaxID=30461 RepID=A0A8C0EKV2_BUBBB